jgi:hypothetical protein
VKYGPVSTVRCVALAACCISASLLAQPVPERPDPLAPDLPERPDLIEFRPAISVDSNINARVGERVRQARLPPQTGARKQELQCHVTCSAFEPGNAILELRWSQKAILEASRAAGGAAGSPELRLDVSGTAGGFRQQTFGTVRLNEIPLASRPTTGPGTGGAAPAATVQANPALLRRVESGQIIARDANLPVFRSVRALERVLSLGTLPQAAIDAVRRDELTGSLGQVQVISKSFERPQANAIQRIQIEGLQPALSYRFRLVEESGNEALSLAEEVCQIQVCPVDYYD